ncbi:globin domain-containing protein [Terriglobus sp. RCC_193]|uniref:globin domain-containing protein n=1 Tax=Terriglobus sp. RCC_193 TaxID=3239218 RepID=UPI003526BA28
MLSPRQLEIVKSTMPALAQHGEEITRIFYANLLGENPQLMSQFNVDDQKSGEQPKRLAQSILAYVANLDRLENLGPAVEKIAHRHVQTHVTPEQYPLVGQYLLQAMKIVLGDAITPEVLEAWTAAYQQLADVMIAREKEIYAEKPALA